ncbi:hypothetical protein SCHPADRAFT_929150 [Schizopora paradoxa]|uniref:F-box domain-containing protein n=1 Tax=Schizopora paradoxa TaxID=27342 RepID=A0A0H2S6U3_9AGAM|nr:hypothetical protein SCHPADRAFT_929150 [Schizopora paradoxa]
MDNGTFARIVRDACRLDSMVSILKILLDNATKYKNSYNQCLRPFSFKYSKGLASLPDELLVHIFKFAALSDETKHAVRLSHVSRKFRALMLEERRFWTKLHSRAKADEVNAFLSRSGQDTGLYVSIHAVSQLFLDPLAFLNICSHTAPRWKSLKISEASFLHRDEATANVLLKDMIRRFDLNLARLQDLEIHGSVEPWDDGDEDVDELRFKFSWPSPNLRVLRCTRFVPLPSPSYSSITSFVTSILGTDRRRFNIEMRQLCSFLVSCPSITDLGLKWHVVPDIDDEERNILPAEPLEITRITSFKLLLSNYPIGTATNHLVLAFMRTFKLTNLDHLSFKVDFSPFHLMGRQVDEVRTTELLLELAHALIPDPFVHRRLTSLSVDLTYEMPRPLQMMQSRQPIKQPRTFTLPLDKIRNVSTLKMTTFARTLFTRDATTAPSGLREIRFWKCKELTSAGLIDTVQSLKEYGAWDTLERFVVEDCNALQHDAVLDAISNEKMQNLDI